LLIANDDQNILSLTVMCGINFLFSFVYYIKSSCMATQITGHTGHVVGK